MKQHPVPQNVTSYQFRLIGDMTLKQFLELLAGGIVAFIFYSTGLPGFIKTFFILISIFSGLAFAFIPLEGRSLDRWIISFFKSIYSPNQFIWGKSSNLPNYLKPNPISKKHPPLPPTKKSQSKPAQKSLPNSPQPISQASDFEKQRISHISSLFNQTTLSTKPLTKQNLPPLQKQPPTPSVAFLNPQQKTTHTFPKKENIKPTSLPQPLSKPNKVSSFSTNKAVHSATTNIKLPFPALPEKPNVLVGMVLNKKNKIIDNAIIEIRDNNNNPVRATKTNKLGQFFSATPLKNGKYTLITERDGFSFDIITINLEGKIYPPLEIRSKSQTSQLIKKTSPTATNQAIN